MLVHHCVANAAVVEQRNDEANRDGIVRSDQLNHAISLFAAGFFKQDDPARGGYQITVEALR